MSLINMTKYRNTELSYPRSVCVCQKVISKQQNLICHWLKNQISLLIGWVKVQRLMLEREMREGGGSSSYCLQILRLIAVMGVKTKLSTLKEGSDTQRERAGDTLLSEVCTLCVLCCMCSNVFYVHHVFIAGYLYYLLRVIGSDVLCVGSFQFILSGLL